MILMPYVITAMPQSTKKEYMETLYRQHHRLMYAVAWSLTRSRCDADEIVSDTCLALIRNTDKLYTLSGNELSAYIAAAVRNAALNHLYKQRRDNMRMICTDIEALQTISEGSAVEKKLLLNEQIDTVWAAIGRLPENERLIMQLKFDRQLSDAEIAEQVGLSSSSIPKYVSRARARLKAMIYTDKGE